MRWDFLKIVPDIILWSGCGVIAALFVLVIWNLYRTIDNWGDLFVQRIGDSPHLSRYLMLFVSIYLAARFIFALIRSGDEDIAMIVQNVFSLEGRFNMTDATGATGVVYLLSKVTDGNILSLFGFGKKR